MSQIDINTQSYLDIKNSVRQYLLSEADDKGNIDVNEFNNWLTTTHDITSGDLKDAAKEDKKQIEKYYEYKKKNYPKGGGLEEWGFGPAWNEIPASIREKEISPVARTTQLFDPRAWSAGMLRYSGKGLKQFGQAILEGLDAVTLSRSLGKSAYDFGIVPDAALPPEIRKIVESKDYKADVAELGIGKIIKNYLSATSDEVDDWLLENPSTSSTYKNIKRSFDPALTPAVEIGSEVGSIVGGSIALQNKLAKIYPTMWPSIQRVLSFGATETLLGNKEENLTSQFIKAHPIEEQSTLKDVLSILAINPEDPEALKVLYKFIDSSGIAVVAEGLFKGIGFAGKKAGYIPKAIIDGWKRTGNRKKGILHGVAEKPQINTPAKKGETSIVDVDVVETDTGNFLQEYTFSKFHNLLTDPLKIAKMPKDWQIKASRAFTSNYGLGVPEHLLYELSEGRIKSLISATKKETKKFIKLFEKTHKIKWKNIPPEIATLYNNALGTRLPLGEGMNQQTRKIYRMKASKRNAEQQAILDKYFEKVTQQARINKEEALKTLDDTPEIKEAIIKLGNLRDKFQNHFTDLGVEPNIKLVFDKTKGLYMATQYKALVNPYYVNQLEKVMKKGLEGKFPYPDVASAVGGLKKAIKKFGSNKDLSMPDDAVDSVMNQIINQLKQGKLIPAHELSTLSKRWITKELEKQGIKTKKSATLEDITDIDFLNNVGKVATGINLPTTVKAMSRRKAGQTLSNRTLMEGAYQNFLSRIDDPMLRWQNTIMTLGDMTNARMFAEEFAELAASKYGAARYTFQEGGSAKLSVNLAELMGKKMADLAKKGFFPNPLVNVWTTPELAKSLEKGIDLQKASSNAFLRMAYASNVFVGGAKTVASHVTHLRNTGANAVVLAANGNLGPSILENLPKVFDTLRNKATPEGAKLFNTLMSHNVIKSGVNQQAFLRTFQDLLKNPEGYATGYLTTPQKIWRPIPKYLGKGMSKAGEIYQLEDDVPKILGFFKERQRYRKAFPDMPEAQLNAYAADIEGRTMPNFGRIPRAVKGLRRYFLGKFPGFHSEILRNMKEIYKIGFRDVYQGAKTKNKELFKIGAARLGSATAVGYGAYEIGALTARQFGIYADELRAVEIIVPEYLKNNNLAWSAPFILDDKGNITSNYLNISYNNPYNIGEAILKSVLPFIIGKDNFTMEGLSKAIDNFTEAVRPIASVGLVTQPAIELLTGRDDKGRPLYKEGDTLDKKAMTAFFRILETVTPGSGTSFKKIIDSYESEQIYKGEGKTKIGGYPVSFLFNVIENLTGLKFQKMILNKSIQAHTYKALKKIDTIGKEYFQTIHQYNRSFYTDKNELDVDKVNEFTKELGDIFKKYEKASSQLALDFNDILKFRYQVKQKDGTFITKKMTQRFLIDNIFSKKGLQKVKPEITKFFQKNQENIAKIGRLNLSRFFIKDDLRMRLQKEQKIPSKVIDIINNNIDKINNRPLFIKSKEEE